MWIPFLYLITSTLSPGPVTVLTVHNTTRYGRLAGIAVTMGGAVTMTIFVGIALALAINNSMSHISLDTANRYQQVGAILILLMGLHIGYRSLFGTQQQATRPLHSGQIAKSFFTGMALMMSYFPPAILFYTVILPRYADPANLNNTILLMGLLKIIITISWYSTLSFTAKSIQKWFFNPQFQRFVELGVACLLVGISITILV